MEGDKSMWRIRVGDRVTLRATNRGAVVVGVFDYATRLLVAWSALEGVAATTVVAHHEIIWPDELTPDELALLEHIEGLEPDPNVTLTRGGGRGTGPGERLQPVFNGESNA